MLFTSLENGPLYKKIVYKISFTFNNDVMIIIIAPNYLRCDIEAFIIYVPKQLFCFCYSPLEDRKTEDYSSHVSWI